MERLLSILRSKFGFSIVMLTVVAIFTVLIFSIIPLNERKFETQLNYESNATLAFIHSLVTNELTSNQYNSDLQLPALSPELLSKAKITTLAIFRNQKLLYQRSQSQHKLDFQNIQDSINFLKDDEYFYFKSFTTNYGTIQYILGTNVAESNTLHKQVRFNFILIIVFVVLITGLIYQMLRISYQNLQRQVIDSMDPIFDDTSANLSYEEKSVKVIDFAYVETIQQILRLKVSTFKDSFEILREQSENKIRELELSQQTTNKEVEEIKFKSDVLYEEIETLESEVASLQKSQFIEIAVTQFNNILQAQQRSLQEWGQQILDSITQQTNSIQGALFSFDSGNKNLQLIGSYNYTLSTQVSTIYDERDGLGSVALKQNQIIHLKTEEVGQFRVLSSATQLHPNSILIVPIVSNDESVGILELSSLDQYTEEQLDFLERIRSFIASSLTNLVNKENIRNLLYEAQEKTEMLMAQEEEMRQNIEELEATQEEMRRVEGELRSSEHQLKGLNENLESIVTERTQELRATLTDLETTQAQLIQSEKMASLGQLVSGVAHEINTPIGAIKASATNMADILPVIIKQLPSFRFDDKHQVLLAHILEDVLLNDQILTSKEERIKRKELMRQLEDLGITDAEEISRKLVEVGVIDRIEKYLPLFDAQESHAILDVVYSLGQLKVNLDNINIAAEKTKKIVFALKNYSYVQNQEAKTMTNVKDSIEIILTLYHNQIKYGIEIVRNYEDIPEVPTYPDELGQIWTNLIHNAIQAMNYHGTLQIDILDQPENIVVNITDSGPGIPPEIQGKIFDAFFTTKAQGEGSGLGLDICRKIVQKHDGKISFQTIPGKTTFTVTLPKQL
ncbi:MAG: GAF domain-containing protein [Bacteroidia bacterium]|nr:GAF domain-containing protein [Bacteroidia bacterium]